MTLHPQRSAILDEMKLPARKTKAVHVHKDPAAVALGRKGGAQNTRAQQEAREQNGQRGGRPGRVCVFCSEPVGSGHDDRKLDSTCGAHGWRWKRKHDLPGSQREALERDLATYRRAVEVIEKRLAKMPPAPAAVRRAS